MTDVGIELQDRLDNMLMLCRVWIYRLVDWVWWGYFESFYWLILLYPLHILMIYMLFSFFSSTQWRMSWNMWYKAWLRSFPEFIKIQGIIKELRVYRLKAISQLSYMTDTLNVKFKVYFKALLKRSGLSMYSLLSVNPFCTNTQT